MDGPEREPLWWQIRIDIKPQIQENSKIQENRKIHDDKLLKSMQVL